MSSWKSPEGKKTNELSRKRVENPMGPDSPDTMEWNPTPPSWRALTSRQDGLSEWGAWRGGAGDPALPGRGGASSSNSLSASAQTPGKSSCFISMKATLTCKNGMSFDYLLLQPTLNYLQPHCGQRAIWTSASECF